MRYLNYLFEEAFSRMTQKALAVSLKCHTSMPVNRHSSSFSHTISHSLQINCHIGHGFSTWCIINFSTFSVVKNRLQFLTCWHRIIINRAILHSFVQRTLWT